MSEQANTSTNFPMHIYQSIKILILVVMLSVGLFMLSKNLSCPPAKVEYRYLPRTLDHLMKDSAFDGDLFEEMYDGEDIYLKMTRPLQPKI